MTLKKDEKLFGYVIYNNDFFPANDLLLSFNNRSFSFGDGFFESIRYSKNHILFWEDHVVRAKATAKLLKLDISIIDWEVLKKQILFLLDNYIGDARVKIHIFRRGGGFYTPKTNEASFLITAYQTTHSAYEFDDNGLKVDIFDEIPQSINKLSSHKTSNALIYILASIYAQENGLDDVFLINQHGNVCETSNSNIFLVFNNIIYTPAIHEGCLDGIMRRKIIQIAEANGFKVNETIISATKIPYADEIFVTNAIKGIRWVSAFKQKRFFHKVSLHLNNLLNSEVDHYIKRQEIY